MDLPKPGSLKLLASGALVAAVLASSLLSLFPKFFDHIDLYTGDWVWRLVSEVRQERRVVLVDIDEGSLARVGPWPWSRRELTKLSNTLSEEGVGLQVFDIVFPEATDGDEIFRETLLKNGGILSQVFALERATQVATGVPQFAMPNAGCPPFAPDAYGYIGNTASLVGVPVGHISAGTNHAGHIRHQPALVCYEEKTYPALFLVALLKAISDPSRRFDETGLVPLRIEAGGLFGPEWWLRGLPVPGGGIPLNEQGDVRIPWWTESQQIVALSAADILEGRITKGLLDKAWVVIGSTALGLNDRMSSPFNSVDAGLVAHTQLLLGALDGRLPVKPAASSVITALLSLLCAVLLHWRFAAIPGPLTLRRRVWGRHQQGSFFTIVVITTLLISLLLGLKVFALLYANYWIDVTPIILYVCTFAVVIGVVESLIANLHKARLYAHLSSYLPKPVAEVLANQEPNGQVSAAKRNITVLVADIRNFSAYCELRPPEETTALLHAFFSRATENAEKFGGRVESFMGDAVLMVWDDETDPRASRPRGRDSGGVDTSSAKGYAKADRALDAALSLLRDTQSLWVGSAQNIGRVNAELMAPLALGIGIETGAAMVGSIGPSNRRSHLVLGHAVMVAERIQEMTIELAHPILLGEGAAAQLSSHQVHSKGNFLLDGLTNPCHIYAYPLEACTEFLESGV